MLKLLRRYWPLIPVVVVFVAAVSREWSNKNTPQPPLYAAASQIPAPVASQPPIPSAGKASNHQPQAKTDATQQQAATDQRGTNETPLVVKILNSPNANAQSTPDKNGHDNEEARNFSLLNVFLVVATLGLFGIGWWQVLISRDTAKKQLRAYVGIKKLSFEISNTHKNTAVVNGIFQHFMVAEVQNFGSTPAKEVKYIGYISRTDFGIELPDDFNFDGPNDAVTASQSGSFISTFLLFPGQSEISKAAITDIAALNDLIAAKARQKSVYFWGRIYYRDIYGRSWRTKFCQVWEPWHPGGERFVPYYKHNEEDRVAFEDLI
ncbi:MAG TPA: hypothetical protein VNW15_16440 [Rhizomicrobium sp.]|nr:hypothetical protein [Rhizomicrobium sp.]